jgi:protein-L-isoaspartate(D-aspartate) O-methyltransferase
MSRRLVIAALLLCTCRREAAPPPAPATEPVERAEPTQHRRGREDMVRETIEARGIRDPRVLAAMRKVPRHEFVPAAIAGRAYEDTPLRIGHDQTISQPYIVALMSEAAQIAPEARVLEIGTGSGYQAAVLAELAAEVYSIEIVEPLGRRAAETLQRLGYSKIHLRIGDGYRGWPEAAPFDAILVTAAPAKVPQPLVDQLAVGGRMVVPVGEEDQDLRVITKTSDGTTSESILPVRFVPMTGEAEK